MENRIKNLPAVVWRSVVEFFQRSFRTSRAPQLTQEQLRTRLREELMQLLAEPQIARSLRNPLVGTVFPFVAGTCGTTTNGTIPKVCNYTASPPTLARIIHERAREGFL